jgi:parallel beta-helix repeat protein
MHTPKHTTQINNLPRKDLCGYYAFKIASNRKEEGKIRRFISIWVCMMLCISTLAGIAIFEIPIGSLYVNTTGSGGAYTSIQDAIDNASAGDTVFVYQGNYNENIIINKSLNMKGENRDNTQIKGDGTGDVVFVNANWVNITGFAIKRGGSGYEDAGLKLIDNGNCKISDNYISNNDYYGIYLYNSSWNEILNNSMHSNYRDCINLKYSRGNDIAGNELFSTEGAGILAYYSDETIIKNNSAWNHWGSIYLLRSNQSSVHNNSVSGSIFGIRGDFCIGNNYTDNTAISNEYAFNIENSKENNILRNTVTSNNKNGIKLFQTRNTNISANEISNSGIGIYLHTTYGPNTVSENTISSNEYGIELYHSGNNWIYHNNFIDNINQAREVGHSDNYLDNGYPSGGNYWSDYEGIDEFHGSDQNILGGDGIGDSHHPVYYDSKDNYPLMELYTIDDFNAPEIQLLSPTNNSVLKPGMILDFDIIDENLFTINYSINGEVDVPLYDPFDVSTDRFADDNYVIQIKTLDIMGNENSAYFNFTIDAIPPTIVNKSVTPDPQEINNSVNISVKVRDIGQIHKVFINILNSNGTSLGNFTMNHLVGSDIFYIIKSHDVIGRYKFIISAEDIVGNWNSSFGTFIIASIPDAPLDLIAVAKNNYVEVNWTAPESNGFSSITNYRVYRGDSPDEFTLLEEIGNITFYEDTSVTDGNTYYYSVSAVNSMGEGLNSNETNVTSRSEGLTPWQSEGIGYIIAVVIMIAIILVVSFLYYRRSKKGDTQK